MNTANLTDDQRRIRQNIRNFFLTATYEELQTVLPSYPDDFSRMCIRELMEEAPCVCCDRLPILFSHL